MDDRAYDDPFRVKLTDEQVKKIRLLHSDYDMTYKQLAERYGVNTWHIRSICQRTRRKDVE